MAKKNKTIRYLKQSAAKGNIASLFEVYNDYNKNASDFSSQQASNYFSQCYKTLCATPLQSGYDNPFLS